MTMQVPDTLEVGGERLRTHANPLGAYFAMAGIESPFYGFLSANWRGYVGAWAILRDRLYLAELRGSDQNEQPIVLKDLFPGYPDRVFVHWFSGEIRCPTGERIQAATRHIYRCEKDRVFTVRRGVVTGHRIVHNEPQKPFQQELDIPKFLSKQQ